MGGPIDASFTGNPNATINSEQLIVQVAASSLLPAGAVVEGIEVDVTLSANYSASTDYIEDQYVLLNYQTLSGSRMSSNHALVGYWPASTTVMVYGGPSDTWGLSGLDATDINDGLLTPSFGVSAFDSLGNSVIGTIQTVVIKVYYHT